MITFIACKRGTTLSSKELQDTIGGYMPLNVLDTFRGLQDSYVPDNLGLSDWVVLLGETYTVYKRIVEPCPLGLSFEGYVGFNTYYIVWPLPGNEEDEEE